MSITLYNTLTRKKETLPSSDEVKARGKPLSMYVCGPTVYDRPHLGNARAVVVYDVLFRLLRQVYGEANVTYVRNITDVDDKINKAAKENGEPIQALTSRITSCFHADMDALHCLRPTHEPRATEFVNSEGGPRDKRLHMVALIQALIENGYAYEVKEGAGRGHVYYDVEALSKRPVRDPESGEEYYRYGDLSGRKLEDLLAETRKEASPGKRYAGDFVLWKPALADDDASSVFDSPWGPGRPGWHIECSAMSMNYLGESFDIHGGGADLKFPHHENEIAQSCGARPGSHFAKLWVHNGFLTVGGEKMSKSLGNFFTVREMIEKLGQRYWPDSSKEIVEKAAGEIIRYVFLSTHYRKPLDWTDKALEDAKKALDKWYRLLEDTILHHRHSRESRNPEPWNINTQRMAEFWDALSDDMNLPKALSIMHQVVTEVYAMGRFLEFFTVTADQWFGKEGHIILQPPTKEVVVIGEKVNVVVSQSIDSEELKRKIEERAAAKAAKNWLEADRIRAELRAMGIELEDRKDGTTDWRRV